MRGEGQPLDHPPAPTARRRQCCGAARTLLLRESSTPAAGPAPGTSKANAVRSWP